MKVSHTQQNSIHTIPIPLLTWFIVLGCQLALLGGALARGLYFQREFLPAHAIMGLLALIGINLVTKRNTFRLNLLDFAVLSMGVVYSLAILGAANVGLAVGEALRVWTYVLYYLLLSRALKRSTLAELYGLGLVGTGFVIAMLGLFTVPGWVRYSGSWTGGVLSSSLQYHNALAAFLLVPMILAAYFWLRAKKHWSGAVLSTGLFFMSLALAGSQSRGGYLIFFLAMAVFVVLNPAGNKHFLVLPVLNVLASLFLWDRFLAAASEHSFLPALLWLASGALWAVAMEAARGFLRFALNRYARPTVNRVFAVSVLVVLGAGLYGLLTHGGQVMARIAQINLHTHSVEERFVFYWDALRMLLKRPLLGYGGGGWEAAYRHFQSYLYYSKETHSILTKILVETGLAGLTALGAVVWGLVQTIRGTWQSLKPSDANSSERNYFRVAIVAFLALTAHALIDFDLSEGAISLMLWSVLAMLRSMEARSETPGQRVGNTREAAEEFKGNRKNAKNKENKINEQRRRLNRRSQGAIYAAENVRKAVRAGYIGTALMLLLLPIPIWLGQSNAVKADQATRQGNYAQAAQYAKAATKDFPLESSYWLASAQANMLWATQTKNGQTLKQAIEEVKRATALNRYDPTTWTVQTNMLSQVGDYDGAFQAGMKVRELAPFDSKAYETFAQSAIYFAVNKANAGDKNAARQAAEQAAQVPEAIRSKVESLPPLYQRNWIVPQRLEATTTIQLAASEVEVLLGQAQGRTSLEQLEKSTPDPKIKSSAHLWLAALALHEGDKLAAQRLEGLSAEERSSAQAIAQVIGSL